MKAVGRGSDLQPRKTVLTWTLSLTHAALHAHQPSSSLPQAAAL